MQKISKVSTHSFSFGFLLSMVVLALFILTPGCRVRLKESGSGADPDTSLASLTREDRKTHIELVSISDSVEGFLSMPEGEGRPPEGPFAVALLFGRDDRLGPGIRLGRSVQIGKAIRETTVALHRSGFAVLETRKKRIGGIPGLIMSGPRVPSPSEIENAIQSMGHIDPETLGVIGIGDGAVAAAELAGTKHFGAALSGAQRSRAPRSATKRSLAFLLLLIELLPFGAPIEAQSALVTVLQGVRAPVLILVLEGDSRESAVSAKETFVGSLDKGNSNDYTVKIISPAETRSEAELGSAAESGSTEIESSGDPGEQNPVQQFIFRWLRARF